MGTLQEQLSRSWIKRGWANPTSTWGKSVPPVWAETPVVFSRRTKVVNPFGALVGGPETTVLAQNCHCELVEVRVSYTSKDEQTGTLLQHSWQVYGDMPKDVSTLPREGDFVSFTKVEGIPVDLQIKHVYVNDQLADHFQVETVEFE